MNYTISIPSILAAAALRQHQCLEQKKTGPDTTDDDQALALISFNVGNGPELRVIRLPILARWAKGGTGKPVAITFHGNEIHFQDAGGKLRLVDVDVTMATTGTPHHPAQIRRSAFERVLSSKPITLKADATGELRPENTVTAESIKNLQKEVTAATKHKKFVLILGKAEKKARETRDILLKAAHQVRDAKRIMKSQSYSDAVKEADTIWELRYNRRQLLRGWQSISSESPIPAEHLAEVQAAVSLATKAIDKRDSYRPKRSFGRTVEKETEKRKKQARGAINRAQFTVDMGYRAHIATTQPGMEIHLCSLNSSRYGRARMTARAWGRIKTELLAYYRSALEECQTAKQNLDSLSTTAQPQPVDNITPHPLARLESALEALKAA